MTDKAYKAAENFENKLRRAFAQIESGKYESFDSVDDLITHLRNRSHTAPRELVDAANKAIDSSHSDNPQDWLDAIDALRSALSAQEPKVCEWVDDDPFWIISCQKVGLSHSFHEPVIVRKWKACPYCTNPIEVKEG